MRAEPLAADDTATSLQGVSSRNPDPTASRHRLAFIDWLRALAILLVFVKHATEVFATRGGGNHLLQDAAARFNFGALGVVVFFAISGFLIPSSLQGPRASGSIRYIISRVFRLYPAFLVSVIPSAAAHFWLGGAAFPLHQILLNFTMLPRLFGGTLANGAYWTLEVEAAFYLICLLLFLGGIVGRSFTFAAILLVTFLIFQSSQQPFFNGLFNPSLEGPTFLFNLDLAMMCWGAVCRDWWGGRRLNVVTAVIFWGFAGFWVVYEPIVTLLAAIGHRPPPMDPNFLSAYGMGTAIFLAAAIFGRLRNRVMLWIGRISYSFYLLHGVAIHIINQVLDRHPAWQGHAANLYTLAALLFSLLLAQLSFSLIERPGIWLGRRLSSRLLRRAAGGGARWWWPELRVPGLLQPLFARPGAPLAADMETITGPGDTDRPPRGRM